MGCGSVSPFVRRCWSGVLAAAMFVASAPDAALARPVGAGERPPRARVLSAPPRARAPQAREVSVGAVTGAGVARQALRDALGQVAARRAGWRVPEEGASGLVLNTNVRRYEVRRDAAGILASCEATVVVVDDRGAVRASVETRRVVRADASADASELERTVLRGVFEVVLRNLEASAL